MLQDTMSPEESESAKPRVNEFRRVIRIMSRRPVVIGGVIVVLLFVLLAILAPLLTQYSPYEQDLNARLLQPSRAHLLGTDELGRDLLTRIIYGTRISLMVGVVAVSIAGLIGMTLGLIAGYFGGWINIIIMRFTDALLAIPPIVLMLAIAAVLGGGLFNVLIALGISMTPTYTRLMCGQVITLRENEYITAAHVIGAKSPRIILHHLLPNAFPPLFVLLSINLGTAIMMEATLSFLGIGIKPPSATWGTMVAVGYRFLLANPVMSFAPGCAILLIVVAFNMVGDGLRDALDPRLRGKI
ncbi:MAG TPA: ABC transporter permease [Syntrophorhabdaceae bacterium]|nr:ABC transporter permease [Syntrophorhabdaceae bacterium]